MVVKNTTHNQGYATGLRINRAWKMFFPHPKILENPIALAGSIQIAEM